MDAVIYKEATTGTELTGAFAVRREVFIEEQEIAEEEEWDGLDDACLQFIARSGRKVIGTGRVRFPGTGHAKIERMAVLKSYRRLGVGTGMLDCIEQQLKEQQVPEAVLHAQVTAIPFYRVCGYKETGPRFYEAGIEHVKMTKRLSTVP